jgi:hypothetical protein
MRLQDPCLDATQQAKIEQFADWILSIGDGTIHVKRKGEEYDASWITIPDDLLIHTDGNKTATLVIEVFPYFIVNYKNSEYLATRVVVSPNNTTRFLPFCFSVELL